jgi:hypothetical protein
VPAPGWSRPLPSQAEVSKRYNARLDGLDRLRAPITAVIDAPDGKGGRRRDQLEGNLQILLHDRVALRLDKVGQTVFQLGADATRYWSLDFTESPIAMVGTHDRVTVHAAEDFGVPIHPLDLIDLLAIVPVPERGLFLRWDSARVNLEITMPPARPGAATRRLTVDGSTYFPRRVELLDRSGGVIASSVLSRFVSVDLPGVAVSRTKVAERYEVRLPMQEARVDFNVYDPVNPGSSLRLQPFDLDALLKAYNVSRVIDLDRERRP